MGFLRESQQRFANKTTKLIGVWWGETFPFWYVCEYPKAGGTWLSRMVADYLDIPMPQYTIMPLGCQCVIHNHWMFSGRLRRVFYLYRDGRDVMVSFYFYRMRNLRQNPDSPFNQRLRARYERAFGEDFDPDNIREHLPAFIDLEMRRPMNARINWPTHVAQWCFPRRDNVAYVSYEELLRDTAGALGRCIAKCTNEPIDGRRLESTVARYSFDRMAGRSRGVEDRSSFLRKGVAGDWRNHFTRRAAEVFDHYAGQTLIDLGYERDRSWVMQCPEAEVRRSAPVARPHHHRTSPSGVRRWLMALPLRS